MIQETPCRLGFLVLQPVRHGSSWVFAVVVTFKVV